ARMSFNYRAICRLFIESDCEGYGRLSTISAAEADAHRRRERCSFFIYIEITGGANSAAIEINFQEKNRWWVSRTESIWREIIRRLYWSSLRRKNYRPLR